MGNNFKKNVFNPVKEDETGKIAKRMIWSSESIEMALRGLEAGKRLVANPFYDKNTKLLKGDLVFQRTDEEIEDFKHCMNDIKYFASICKLMTPEGIQHVTMRDYQNDYLDHLAKNRLSIFLSCRQSGKCNSLIDKQLYKFSDEFLETLDAKLKKQWFENYHIYENEFELPMFEIVNLFRSDLKWKIKYVLYKMIFKLRSWREKSIQMIDLFTKILYFFIHLIDKNEKEDEKLIWSHILNGVNVLSEKGWVPAAYIHLTKPFEVYRLETENGLQIECADEHLVFDENMQTRWVVDLKKGDLIQTEYGLDKVKCVKKVGDPICMGDITVLGENESYYSNHILSHNTTTSAIFLLHYILFNTDKNALVLGNKLKTAVEILDKIKKIFLELPYYLKPGVYKWNETEIVFDNGCRIMAEATTINSGISFTFHCVLADEFAHIAPNILEKFYNNLFPTITAGKARFIISSTQNGYNLFYRLYHMAVEGINEYAPFKVDWYQVPEWDPDQKCWVKRDEAWHQLQVANYGSEEAFNAQFGTNFDTSANTLISSKVLRVKEQNTREFVHKPMDMVYDSYFWWDPDLDLDTLSHKWITITTDISEGLGGDYTVNMINELFFNDSGEICSRAIGYFKCNDKDVPECVSIIRQFCITYLDQMKYLLSIEYNLFGELYIRCLKEEMNDDFDNYSRFNEDNIVRYYNEDQTKFVLGVRMTPKTKLTAVTQFKQYYEKGRIVNESMQFMNELTCFCDSKGNNTFQASFGHDDLVMSQLQQALVFDTPQFKELVSLMQSESPSTQQTEDYFDIYTQMSGGTDIYSMYGQTNQDNSRRFLNQVNTDYRW